MSDLLAFFGGSFDPIHHGHLIVARSIAEQLGLRRIVLVPAAQSPHKSRICASGAQRLEMIRLAIAGEAMFEVSDVEISRGSPSYTFETLEELRRRHGRQTPLAWVIGADMLADLPKWLHARELIEQFEMIIAARPSVIDLDQTLIQLEKSLGAPEGRLRRWVVRNPLIDISATDIRQRIASGKSIAYLVPPAVCNYLFSTKLYGAVR